MRKRTTCFIAQVSLVYKLISQGRLGRSLGASMSQSQVLQDTSKLSDLQRHLQRLTEASPRKL